MCHDAARRIDELEALVVSKTKEIERLQKELRTLESHIYNTPDGPAFLCVLSEWMKRLQIELPRSPSPPPPPLFLKDS